MELIIRGEIDRPIHEMHIEKIGNLLLYIASRASRVVTTKLLKLLYIIDEESVKKTGVPITWLEYKVWKRGPVSKPIYLDLTWHEAESFAKYVRVEKVLVDNRIIRVIQPNAHFDKFQFSPYELKIIDGVLEEYGECTSDELVSKLHEEGTLWHRIVSEQSLEQEFQNGETNTSPFVIDLSELIKDDETKLNRYFAAKESIEFQEMLDK